jgi:hypothetical protein
VWHSGSWCWYRDASRQEQTSAIGYEVNTLEQPPWLRLTYTFTEKKDALDYHVQLVTTWPRFGGLRWWFVCPLVVGGRPCDRRVGKLYLPPRARYFGCRHCHRLTYRSAQEHDKRVDLLCRHPELIDALLNGHSNPTQLGLALKVFAKQTRRLSGR